MAALQTGKRSNKRRGTISEKQLEILDYMKQVILDRGYPPSVREICDAVQLKSTSSVFSHLARLEDFGYIRRDPTKPRAIEIIDSDFNDKRKENLFHVAGSEGTSSSGDFEGASIASFTDKTSSELINVPIVGTVAAGQPILATENIEQYFPIPAEYMPREQSFMLKVKGESMINAGILDGDTLLVEQTNTARDGEMVVALVDDSATVKTFYKEDGHIRLQPENDTMEPIIVDDCKILGKVFGVIRFF